MGNEKHITEIEGKLIRLKANKSLLDSEESRCYDRVEEIAEEKGKVVGEIKEAERELRLLK